MAADPEVAKVASTSSWTMVKYLVPAILIIGAVGLGLIYIRAKIEKKIKQDKKHKDNNRSIK